MEMVILSPSVKRFSVSPIWEFFSTENTGIFFNGKHVPNRVFLTSSFLSTEAKIYLEVLFGTSGTYKFNYTLKSLLSQNMVHFT